MAWTLPSTRTEAGLTVRSSLHKDVDLCLFGIGPLNLLEDEALEFLDVIEDSVKKHLGSFLFESDEDVDNPHYLNKRTGMHSPQILNP